MTLNEFVNGLLNGGPALMALIFLFVFLIQFVLVFMLYRSNKQSNAKISDLENLIGVTADRVLEMSRKTDVVTYKEAIRRLKAGQKPNEVANHVQVDINELEALQKVIQTTERKSKKD